MLLTINDAVNNCVINSKITVTSEDLGHTCSLRVCGMEEGCGMEEWCGMEEGCGMEKGCGMDEGYTNQ